MLSSQTKDPVTHAAVAALRASLGGVLSLATLRNASADEIDAAICKVGFHQTKAKNLVKLAVRLEELHGGLVPEDLRRSPGCSRAGCSTEESGTAAAGYGKC